jgi:hypothetical protein
MVMVMVMVMAMARLRRLSELRGDEATRTPAERLVEGGFERIALAEHRLQLAQRRLEPVSKYASK